MQYIVFLPSLLDGNLCLNFEILFEACDSSLARLAPPEMGWTPPPHLWLEALRGKLLALWAFLVFLAFVAVNVGGIAISKKQATKVGKDVEKNCP